MSNKIELDTSLKQTVSSKLAYEYHVIPKKIEENTLHLWIDETQMPSGIEKELSLVLNKPIELSKTSSNVIGRALSEYYRINQNKKNSISVKDDFLDQVIQEAKVIGSSDIHIEAYEKKARVRMRVDGKLIERFILKKEEYPTLVNKVKVKGNLDISEKRLPQDGRISYRKGEHNFDIRVSILPTIYGEKIVLRLLGSDDAHVDIHEVGFNETDLKKYMQGIKKPHGIVLISGPTGSGKTTTLYATLKYLNSTGRNITTIEDPIEYILEGINQVQLKESIGLTFASALNSFLRQDPDIIMVGEIRDEQTAQMAIRAALTGHLVFSTIHTNSSLETITRLIDIGVPPFLLSSTLNLSIAQRLIRKLCEHCKEKSEFKKELLPGSYSDNQKSNLKIHYTPKGCDQCHYTGYKGRMSIFEILYIDTKTSEYIKKNSLIENQENLTYTKIKEAAFNAVEKGTTSIEEVYALLIE